MQDPNYDELQYISRYPDIKSGFIFSGTDGKWFYQSNLVKGWVIQAMKLSDHAFWHWSNFGLSEGRVCGFDLPGTIYSSQFDSHAYLARYPDIRVSPEWKNNPQGHYQAFGLNEGRHPGFEIITSASAVGMVSPGTTQLIDSTTTNIVPGDSGILTSVPIDATASIADTTPVISTGGAGVSTWIAANPTLTAAIAAGLIIVLSKKKKQKYSYR